MERIVVEGGRPLYGEAKLQSAKNAVLPIIAACILCEDEVRIKNCPRYRDVEAMLSLVNALGGSAYRDGEDAIISFGCSGVNDADGTLTGKIRSSFFILGPVLSRYRRARVSYPGGCEIGLRPVDIHLYGLRRLGVKITEEGGWIACDGTAMRATEITLDFPSVGATENLIMAAVLLSGKTVIRSAAREPEIEDLAAFINAMGGRVYGAGTDEITVEGVERLHGCEYEAIPDRIVGGTLLIACAAAGGSVRLTNFRPDHTFSILEKLGRCGCEIRTEAKAVEIVARQRPNALHKVETMPYPGFPTDVQAQLTAMLSVANGTSMIVENLFESRYRYTAQLVKMGASITVRDRIAVVKGKKRLHGAVVLAEDLRGGAALVIAALAAEGKSIIDGVEHIDRGYYRLEETLALLGGIACRKR